MGLIESLLIEVLLKLNRAYCRLWCRWSASGSLPIPFSGPAIVIANHISPLDPLVLQSGTSRPIGYMIAREYYEMPMLRWLCRMFGCIPVKRTGNDVAATKAALRYLAQGNVLGIFPEGRMNLSDRPLLPLRSGVAMLALKARVPVIPAYITGVPPGHTMIRPFLTPCRVYVKYGQPIDLSAFYDRSADRRTLKRVAQLLARELAKLSCGASK